MLSVDPQRLVEVKYHKQYLAVFAESNILGKKLYWEGLLYKSGLHCLVSIVSLSTDDFPSSGYLTTRLFSNFTNKENGNMMLASITCTVKEPTFSS